MNENYKSEMLTLERDKLKDTLFCDIPKLS